LIILQIKENFAINNNEVIILFAILSASLIIFNQFFRMFGTWFTEYVCNIVWLNIHSNLFQYYVNQPFSYHIETNSNSLLEKIQIRASAAVLGIINPFYQILGHFFVLIFLSLALVIANPLIALFVLIITSTFYILFFWKIKKRLILYGKFSPEFYNKTFKLVKQAFRSIKDIKIKQNGNYYTNIFDPLAKKYAYNQVKVNFLSSMPRNVIEIFAYLIGFSLVIYFIISESQKFGDIAVIIGIYAITLQKLLPAIQGAFQSIAKFKFYKPSFDIIYDDLVASQKSSEKSEIKNIINSNQKKIFDDKIVFKNIKFKYPNSHNEVLNIENLELNKGTFLGITGKSGSGKSTFIDLLTGLLSPTKGNIFLDGKKIDSNLKEKLQTCIGYVPQFSFIADDTIKNNITLGLKSESVDFERVKKVAEIANISAFIEKELPLGYETIIGEDGVKLSGGQRQRISIARALYAHPQILILDEATNSLDSLTENQIIKSIAEFKKIKTIIMVTHRVQTLRACDEILFFDGGKLEDRGDYAKLTQTNSKFKDMETKSMRKEIYGKEYK